METPPPSPSGDTLTAYQQSVLSNSDALVAIAATAAFLLAIIAAVVFVRAVWVR